MDSTKDLDLFNRIVWLDKINFFSASRFDDYQTCYSEPLRLELNFAKIFSFRILDNVSIKRNLQSTVLETLFL